jgi:membrane fusion protein, heavy metal efflux system
MRAGSVVLFITLAAVLLSSCNSSPKAVEIPSQKQAKQDEVVLSAEQQSAAMIGVQPASISQQPDLLRVRGKIALADDRTWRVGVRTTGMVSLVYAGLGDYVRKGQVLVRYRADEVRDSRAQYRAALSDFDRAQAAAAQAQRNRDRAQRLLELRAGSIQQVEGAQQDLVSARATVKRAEIEVRRGRDLLEDDLRVPADPPPDRKDETEDEVPIIAPGDGYVIEKNVTPGKTVELSSVTFVIGDLTKVWMLASVHQEDLAKLRQGQPASVTLAGIGGAAYRGRIANLGQEFDPATRMIQVRIELDNPGGRLRPEMLSDAEIPVGAGRRTLIVPSGAIQQVYGQDVVFLRTAPGRFTVRPVQVGETVAGNTPILQGLRSGDMVVIRGSFVLKSQLLKAMLESE